MRPRRPSTKNWPRDLSLESIPTDFGAGRAGRSRNVSRTRISTNTTRPKPPCSRPRQGSRPLRLARRGGGQGRKSQGRFQAAQAQVQVAAANLKMAKVFVQYTRIESPYDGVVIARGEAVHPGSFVRAADQGGNNEPLLTVAMTAKMRTIVPVPDRDVPYCQVGDPATVTLDALAGRVFHGKVDRTAESETLARLMVSKSISIIPTACFATECLDGPISFSRKSSRTSPFPLRA